MFPEAHVLGAWSLVLQGSEVAPLRGDWLDQEGSDSIRGFIHSWRQRQWVWGKGSVIKETVSASCHPEVSSFVPLQAPRHDVLLTTAR